MSMNRPESEIHMIEVTSPDVFITEWNNMGIVDGKEVEIDYVRIYTHGTDQALIFENGSPTNAINVTGVNSQGNKIGKISDLKEKTINKDLSILACNAGHIGSYKFYAQGNVASNFSKIVKGTVYAYDGNVSFGSETEIAINKAKSKITGNSE